LQGSLAIDSRTSESRGFAQWAGTAVLSWSGGVAYLPGSELGGLLDISPTSVELRMTPVEAFGPEEED
jgi:hypothetical protein